MKIGILILAHNNPEQLQMLVDSLKEDFSVYIHLDAKSELSMAQFAGETNVYAIKRYSIFWGHISMVDATISLLQMAYNDNCDYYMLISGADVKISNNVDICKAIQINPERNYMNFRKLPIPEWPMNGGFDRLKLFWLDKLQDCNHPKALNRICGLLRRIQKKMGLRRKLLSMVYYGGSQWFNLSKNTVGYILNFLNENQKYRKQFEYTRCSDEIFFQTIVMNSKYSDKVENDSKRYIDWKSGPEYPRTLRMEDYEKIKNSDAFFARKFNMRTDMEVIKEIKNSLI